MSICSKKSENLTDTEDVKNKTLTETLETTTRTTRTKTIKATEIKISNSHQWLKHRKQWR